MSEHFLEKQTRTDDAPPPSTPPIVRSGGFGKAQVTDWLFTNATRFFALTTVLLIVGIAFALYWISRDNIHHNGLQFLTTTKWDPIPPDEDKPHGNLFGALPFIYGTLITSVIALVLAVPLGLGAAIFLSEVAPRWLSTPLSFLVELLAAVPSIVYGFWALKYLVPLFGQHLEPWLNTGFGQVPFFAMPPESFSGQDYLVAGSVLALMVLPFVTAISRDVLRTVPSSQREAAYGLGATRWETISKTVLRYGSSGIIGAVMLGLGRALGETMAVTIVIGSAPNFPVAGDPATFSLMRPGYTMASLLADQYPNPNPPLHPTDPPLHASALTEIALVLFAVTIVVNGLARGLVWLMATQMGGKTESEFTARAKSVVGLTLRYGFLLLLARLLLGQIVQDIHAKGILGGLFSVATLLSLALIGLAIFNQQVKGTRLHRPWRKLCNASALSLCGLCTLIASGALIVLLLFVAKDGISAIHPQFFLPPNPTDPQLGGMLHAMVGTGLLVLAASVLGIPLGVMGGLFLSEFGDSRFGGFIRFCTDLLNGVPSIVIGIFAYILIIVPTKGNFGYAGSFALGVMMIPTVMRTTEELVRLVPMSLREGSLALGATRAWTTWKVILPAARAGIITGALLAVARIAGETAPLLMVGCNSSLWVTNLAERMSSLPVQIYVLRDNPTELAASQSWGVALVLVMLVLVFSLLARFFTREKMRMTA
ncbi:MAG TPA: phosphate ABC transporter permease subunit PstC [Chthonomonadaceae bacterium]|nr:phosphate ABC transporter permease subunit PstC [Chthonomonadaceae bacterium]